MRNPLLQSSVEFVAINFDDAASLMKIVQTRRGNNFDLLRLVFASMVILSHGAELVTGDRSREPLTMLFHSISFGELGVDGFFILSGYLVTKSWLNKPDPIRFSRRRLFRIVPGFVAAYLLSGLLFPLVATPAALYFSQMYWPRFAFGLLTFNQTTPSATPAVYGNLPVPLADGSLWTIRFELACYAGVAALGLLGLLQRRVWVAALYLITTAFLVRSIKEVGIDVVMNTLVRLGPYYLAGMVFSLYEDRVRYSPLTIAAGWAALIGCLWFRWTAVVLLPIPLAFVIFWVGQVPMRVRAFMARSPDISYGVYLYAWPTTKMLQSIFPGISILFLTLGTFVVSFALGYGSYMLVERWFLADRSPRTPTAAGA